MKSVLGILVVLGVLQSVLLLLGVGVGFLLHAAIPDVSIGTAILVGAMCSISSGLLFVQFLQYLPNLPLSTAEEDGDEDEEDEDEEMMEYEDVEFRRHRPRSRAGRHRRRRR